MLSARFADMDPSAHSASERIAATPAVDIVIVNWNAGALLRSCVAALEASSIASRLHVIVVDNASTDGSVDGLAVAASSLSVIRNAENRGFAAACNQGAAAGRAPLLLFLNPDVRVAPDAIAQALDFLAEPAQTATGIVGIRLLDRQGRTSQTCARRPTVAAMLLRTLFLDRIVPHAVPPHFITEWDHLDTRAVDQVMGAFLMIRRDLFGRAGGFDQRFFVYYEDLDLCLRASDDGHAVVHFAAPTAVHDGGGTTNPVKDRRLFYETANRVRFMHKWHGMAAAGALAALIAVVELPLRVIAGTAHAPHDGWMVMRGALLFWRNLPRLMRELSAAAPR
jgi:N-acetylglucosaminyl-diphospho-decaprenol L-rhamnosyltransferase